MRLHTIGFSGKSAEKFFTLLQSAGVQKVVDIRRSNNTLYAGFTRARDMPYFLERLCGMAYVHEPEFAPSLELLRAHQARIKKNKKDAGAWGDFERAFSAEIQARPIARIFAKHGENVESVCFLCSEATAEHCHRRLLAEYLADQDGQDVQVIHL